MKENAIAVLLLFIAVICWVTVVNANESNEVLKKCLIDSGYTKENFDTYNFSKAAKCHSDYRVGMQKVKNEETREFLKKKPWYKGKNWNWEDKAEYTCHEEYHTGYTFCHRPHYIN